MFTHQFVGRLGLFVSVLVFANACVGGEIGDVPGGARLGPEASDPEIGNEASPLVCPGASPDVSANNGWRSSEASLPADGALRFELKARPTAANLNGLVAVGAEDIDDFPKAAIAVRFGDNGLVDVRDGAFYSSDQAYPYDPGVWYSISISADIDAETYDVEIGPCGEPRKMLINDASFRDDASVSGQLSDWAVWSSQTAALEVSTPAWMGSEGCAPATCLSLGHACGTPQDGCGGVLSCGVCGDGEMCSSGTCINAPANASPPPPPACTPATCQSLGTACGQWSDGCGAILSCGSCNGGQLCSAGICVDAPPNAPPPPACTPATCQSLGKECAQWGDGCGGTLSCGSCSGGETCSIGVCVPPPPPCEPATCQTLSAQCGVRSDGCGGTVNCGSCAGGDVCVSGGCYDPGTALEPENTQGDSWETIYEACTDDDYPSGYRPPLFVRPTMQNTGVNCPDKASGCPADATLTPLGFSTITSPGTYENFSLTGTLRIEANDVTIRNFEITCAGGFGIVTEKGYSNIRVEYGTVKKGATACTHVLVLTAGKTYATNVHVDQCGDDCIQSNGVNGPVMVERSLFTRPGDNGGYGSGSHADTWQYYNPLANQYACWLGSRVVPSYCPNFYKNSNITQSGGLTKWYLYNNWFDQSTNVMIAGDGGIVRNNKFGNWRAGGGYWFTSAITDMGGNVFECNGQPLSGGGSASPQPTCPWGFSNHPVTGWDGVSIHGTTSAPLDGGGSPFACSGTVDSQPIDPTEFCTSDGSGCVVTP